VARRHQLCWSHLIRHYQALVDRGGREGVWGTDFLVLSRLVFREGTIDRETLQAAMAPLQVAIHGLFSQGARRCDAPEGLCQELLAHEDALWTFVREERVEPTGYPLGECSRTSAPSGGDLAEELFWRAQRRWKRLALEPHQHCRAAELHGWYHADRRAGAGGIQ
jgi:hypothetical protein